MKKKVIYSLIMDRSSSMWEIQGEILQSVNERIRTIKAMETEKEEQILTDFTLFNETVSRSFSLLPQKDLTLLTEADYNVNGTTALYDALGSTLERLYLTFYDKVVAHRCKIVVVVYTDGYENASRLYSREAIRQMLAKANELEGVEVSIVGCEMDTLTMAQEMNFKASNSVRVQKGAMADSLKEMDRYFDDFRKDKKTTFKESLYDFDLDKDEDSAC